MIIYIYNACIFTFQIQIETIIFKSSIFKLNWCFAFFFIYDLNIFGPDFKPNECAFFSAEILFDDLGNGQTRYTAIARHWNVEDCETHEKMGFHDGWGQVATQLEAVASKL